MAIGFKKGQWKEIISLFFCLVRAFMGFWIRQTWPFSAFPCWLGNCLPKRFLVNKMWMELMFSRSILLTVAWPLDKNVAANKVTPRRNYFGVLQVQIVTILRRSQWNSISRRISKVMIQRVSDPWIVKSQWDWIINMVWVLIRMLPTFSMWMVTEYLDGFSPRRVRAG